MNRCVDWRLAMVLLGIMSATNDRVRAEVDLVLEAASPQVQVGEVLEVAVYAVSGDETDQLIAAVQMMFSWDPGVLQLLGIHQDGAANLLLSTFPKNDPYGVNEVVPPQNGVGMYQAWAPLGDPVVVTPTGTLLATFEFEALAVTDQTWIDILPQAGDPAGETIVFDGTTPNTNVTGLLVGTSVSIHMLGDLNGDGVVDVFDLLLLLDAWGACPGEGGEKGDCPADLNGDGIVNVHDLLILLSNWG